MVTLRKAVPSDLPALAPILVSAFNSIADAHNFPRDFQSVEMAQGLLSAFLNHPKIPGLVAEENGTPIGSNFIDTRDPIAAVGPITVSPEQQSKGAGRLLMQAVIELASQANAKGIRLVQDAFNRASMSLYTSVGFDIQEPLVLLTGKITAPPPANVECRPLTQSDLPAAEKLCAQIHTHPRTNELADALNIFNPQGLFKNNQLVAYASSPWLWFLNHGVAQTDHDLQNLLTAASHQSPAPLSLLYPTRQATTFRWLLKNGLKIVKPMTLMTMGPYQPPKGAWFPSVGY